MDVSYSVELSHAFVVAEEDLEKLSRLLTNRIGDVEIRADCADEVSRTFSSVQKLMAFENARGKHIQSLHLSARSDDFTKRGTIDLSGSRWRGISLNFQAREDVVSRLREEVLDILAGTRPWYAMFHRVDFVIVSLVSYILLWITMLIMIAFGRMPAAQSQESSQSNSALAQLIVFGGIAVLFATGIVLNRFRDSLFPRAAFMIGQGKNRFQHLERVQWSIVIAFVVSFAAGLIIAVWQAISA